MYPIQHLGLSGTESLFLIRDFFTHKIWVNFFLILVRNHPITLDGRLIDGLCFESLRNVLLLH